MEKYFLHDGQEHVGPFSLDNLKDKKITKETPIWFEGITDWTAAGKIDELKSLFQPVPPPFKVSSQETTILNMPPPLVKKYDKQILLSNIKDNSIQEDIIVLILGAKMNEVFINSLFRKYNLKDKNQLKDLVSIVKEKRKSEIDNILNSKAKNMLDETIALYLMKDDRSVGEMLWRGVTNKNYSEGSIYVAGIVTRYQIDMSAEKKRKEAYEEKKRKAPFYRTLATIILAFLTFELFQAKAAFSVSEYETTLFRQLWEWLRGFLGLPDIFGYISKFSFFITILFISYLLKTIISGIILITGDKDYDFGTFSKNLAVSSLFGWLCAIECVVFGLQFGFSPFWDFVKSIFALQIPTFLMIGLLFDD